ncbi:MAG: hypothetical protein ACQEQC_08100 [Elusimicrobiota bacterium]
MYGLLILILFSVIIWAVFNFTGSKSRKVEKLKEKYYRISGLPRDSAGQALKSQIEKLKKKHPDKDMEWYLDKIIFDLEKDKY